MIRCETIGDATLYLGDCREVLPSLVRADAIVTDPPYGQGIASTPRVGADGAPKISGKRSPYDGSAGRMACTVRQTSAWDDEPLSPEMWRMVESKSDTIIAFGFNRLAHVYGPSPKALIWDKKTKNDWRDTFADAEIAWTRNVPGPTRVFRHLWVGGLRASEHEIGDKLHPAQKPIAVMAWCIEQLPAQLKLILDPFMGSGSTGAAALAAGRRFIGIEADPHYFEIACERIAAAWAQPRLFPNNSKDHSKEEVRCSFL